MAAARAGDAFPSRMPARSGRPLSSDGGSGGETWKSDIVRQLKHRDRNQHVRFQDLVRFCKFHHMSCFRRHLWRLHSLRSGLAAKSKSWPHFRRMYKFASMAKSVMQGSVLWADVCVERNQRLA